MMIDAKALVEKKAPKWVMMIYVQKFYPESIDLENFISALKDTAGFIGIKGDTDIAWLRENFGEKVEIKTCQNCGKVWDRP